MKYLNKWQALVFCIAFTVGVIHMVAAGVGLIHTGDKFLDVAQNVVFGVINIFFATTIKVTSKNDNLWKMQTDSLLKKMKDDLARWDKERLKTAEKRREYNVLIEENNKLKEKLHIMQRDLCLREQDLVDKEEELDLREMRLNEC